MLIALDFAKSQLAGNISLKLLKLRTLTGRYLQTVAVGPGGTGGRASCRGAGGPGFDSQGRHTNGLLFPLVNQGAG